MWNFGFLASVTLVVQIITGIFLGMFYILHLDIFINKKNVKMKKKINISNKVQNLVLLHADCHRVLHSSRGLPERKISLLKSFSNKKTSLFNNSKRSYVKKYFYGYLGMFKNKATFKYLKSSLNHTCFYAKDVKGVDQKIYLLV